MTPVPQKDIFGREIQVGDYVVYAIYSEGSGLQHGEVIDLPTKMVKRTGPWDPATRTYGPPVFQAQTKVQINVATTRWDSQAGTHVPCVKKRTLDTPSRFCVVPKPENLDAGS